MAHNFDCVIDTHEMAQEVKSVKKHVDGTTTAVVAMQTAVIDAQKKGADRVCAKVNQGFYSLIHSQISQKMATLQSKVDAQLLRLQQQKKQLNGIQNRMERDYQMISGRYLKIFNGLNRNLSQRITELDRPILKFASTETDKISNRSTQLISAVPVGQAETIKVSQKVTASNLKYRASKAIQAITRFIADSNQLKAITDRILLSRPIKTDDEMIMVPVGILETNFDSSGTAQTEVFISQINMSKEARQTVETRINAATHEDIFNWKEAREVNPEVANYFRQLVSTASIDQRRKDTILKMFGKNKFETL